MNFLLTLLLVVLGVEFLLEVRYFSLSDLHSRKTVLLWQMGVLLGATSLLLFLKPIPGSFAWFFWIALVFSFMGDLFMAERLNLLGNRLINGFLSFSLALLCYTLGLINWVLHYTSIITVFGLEILLFLLPVFIHFLWFKSSSHPTLRKIGGIYAFFLFNLLGFSLVTGIFLALAGSPWQGGALAGGGAFFVLSDLLLAGRESNRWKPEQINSAIHGTYFLGQFLLQLSWILLV